MSFNAINNKSGHFDGGERHQVLINGNVNRTLTNVTNRPITNVNRTF